MVRRELCHEWYHFTCVDIKTYLVYGSMNVVINMDAVLSQN